MLISILAVTERLLLLGLLIEMVAHDLEQEESLSHSQDRDQHHLLPSSLTTHTLTAHLHLTVQLPSLHERRAVVVEGDLLIILTILTRVRQVVCVRRSHLTMGGEDHRMTSLILLQIVPPHIGQTERMG